MPIPPRKHVPDFTPPSECPVCGADVPPRARACPSCGADERTGWNDDATRYDGLDLPDDAFDDSDSSSASSNSRSDHNPTPGSHASRKPSLKPNGVPLFWWILAILLLASLIASTLGIGF